MHRLFAAGALLAAYIILWRPLRAVFMQEMAWPLLALLLAGTGVAIEGSGDPRMLFMLAESSSSTSIRAPGGILFLLPALVLAAAFPRRLYWGYLLIVNLSLRFLEWAFRIGGLVYWENALQVADFVAGYVIPAICIGLPILLIQRSRL